MKDILNRWKFTVAIFVLPFMSYLILGPLEIYAGNEKDFAFAYSDFFVPFLLIALGGILVLSFLVSLLPDKVNKIVNVIVLCFGVLSYAQNMFLNTKLSEADGSPMNWDELGSWTVISLVILAAIAVVIVLGAVLLKNKWNLVSTGVAAFLSIVQLVAVVSLLFTATPSTSVHGNLSLSGDDQYKVASDENIIVIVLDTFGNDLFEYTLENNPEFKDIYKDFTYYNNAECHYYCTFPSMTHIFTGNEFDFKAKDSETWLEESWNSEKAQNFFDEIKEAGYVSNLYSTDIAYVYGTAENLYNKFDNCTGMNQVVDKNKLLPLFAKMSAYRYVPYVLKPKLEVLTYEFNEVISYEDAKTVTDDNGEFYKGLKEEGLSIKEGMQKGFITEHLFGMHKPYTIDSNANSTQKAEKTGGNDEGLSEDTPAYDSLEETSRDETAEGLNVILKEYLEQLKTLGVYDKATIIITADHASWHGDDVQPLMLVKRSGETGDEMKLNSAPVSLDDFQATIIDIIGNDYSKYGKSMFEYKEGEKRDRECFMRVTDSDLPAVENSSFNAYYGYKYSTDRKELLDKINNRDYEIQPATKW